MIVEIIIIICSFLIGCGITTVIFINVMNRTSGGTLVVTQNENEDPDFLLDISRSEISKMTSKDYVRFRVKHRKTNMRRKHSYYYDSI